MGMGPALKKSPLAPDQPASLPAVKGVGLSVAATGSRYKGRNDLVLAVLSRGTSVAGCFTSSKTRSAPVDICRENLTGKSARAIIVNAGNANAFTGKRGDRSARTITAAVASRLGCKPDEVFIASTGVIGELLDPDPIIAHISGMVERVDETAWHEAAHAIMTTDTFAKMASVEAMIDGEKVVINGIAKGSGMIAPDMATMLVFLFTDAAIPADVLQQMLTDSVDDSFNAITVDSDTSTSDTVLLCATGKAGVPLRKPETAADEQLKDFRASLDALTRNLAQQVVRDGEGAQKFISITVTGAENNRAARRIGLAIANSPLVKTAIAGSDANWGRIVMAVGKSGEAADRDRLSIHIGGTRVAFNGEPDPDYREAEIVPHMHGREIDIAVDVGIADGKSTVWTCDLTHQYIDINADYRS